MVMIGDDHFDLLLTMIRLKSPKIKFSDEALRLQTPNMANSSLNQTVDQSNMVGEF